MSTSLGWVRVIVGVINSDCTAAASELDDCCTMHEDVSTTLPSQSREPDLPEQQSMTLSGSGSSDDGNCTCVKCGVVRREVHIHIHVQCKVCWSSCINLHVHVTLSCITTLAYCTFYWMGSGAKKAETAHRSFPNIRCSCSLVTRLSPRARTYNDLCTWAKGSPQVLFYGFKGRLLYARSSLVPSRPCTSGRLGTRLQHAVHMYSTICAQRSALCTCVYTILSAHIMITPWRIVE